MTFELKGTRNDFPDFHGVVYLDEETYPDIITISYFSILTAQRRKGHGKRLVQHLEEMGKKQNKDLVFVCVAPDADSHDGLDSPMYELLQSLGYRYMDQTIHMCKNPNLNVQL